VTRASILVPTHNRPGTLPFSVGSALAQTESDLEVIIIGDGVTPEVRRTAQDLVAHDSRVVFLDLPKGENHGEVHRDTAIGSARSDAIFYLCDDDLLMPSHVSDLLGLLHAGRTFVQSLNGWIDLDGVIHRSPGWLDDPVSVSWVMQPRWNYNFISLTGTAHSRRFYQEVGHPWSATPAGDWPDRYQWRMMLYQRGFSGATSRRMTALQFPASEPARAGITERRQLAEIKHWAKRIQQPGAQQQIDGMVAEATDAALIHVTRLLIASELTLRETAPGSEDMTGSWRAQTAELEELRRWREDMLNTLSWRITRPLRAIRRRS